MKQRLLQSNSTGGHQFAANGQLLCLLIASLALLAGCNDNLPPVSGRVTVDGQPATGGMLLLPAVGQGTNGFSNVNEKGEFVARTKMGVGLPPGQYKATYRVDLSEEMRARVPENVRKMMTGDVMTITYRSPYDFRFEVAAEGQENLEINVDTSAGWKPTLSD